MLTGSRFTHLHTDIRVKSSCVSPGSETEPNTFTSQIERLRKVNLVLDKDANTLNVKRERETRLVLTNNKDDKMISDLIVTKCYRAKRLRSPKKILIKVRHKSTRIK